VSLHRKLVHPEYVESCFGCRAASIRFNIEPTNDTQRAQYEGQRQWAAEFHNGDREAYRRLRQNGLQPPRIAGSAELERHAETRFEVETGRVAHGSRRELTEALSFAADNGVDPLKAVTTPVED
jgi:hypothetical protein